MKKILFTTIFCLVAANAVAAEENVAKPEPAAKKATAESKVTEKSLKRDAAKEEKKAAAKSKVEKRSNGLIIEDLVVGSGKEAQLNKDITVHYRGTLKENGKEFDSSYKSGEPITFTLAEGRLIKGWTEGIPGMKVGGKRKLTIPSALAYGERGTPGGPIGANKDLVFEVELKDVK